MTVVPPVHISSVTELFAIFSFLRFSDCLCFAFTVFLNVIPHDL